MTNYLGFTLVDNGKTINTPKGSKLHWFSIYDAYGNWRGSSLGIARVKDNVRRLIERNRGK